jgi:hypothetical protein
MDAPNKLMEEAEEMEATTMDVEEDNDNNASIEQGHPNVHAYGGVPKLSQNTSTPIIGGNSTS